MHRGHSTCRSFTLLRLARSAVARWVAVAVLMPLLSVGALRGGVLVAHSHGQRDIHLHLYSAQSRGACLAETGAHLCHGHAAAHESAPDEEREGGTPACGEDCLSVAVSVPSQNVPTTPDLKVVHETLPECPCDTGPGLAPARALRSAGPPSGVPLALPPPPPTACARLLRTSRALLL